MLFWQHAVTACLLTVHATVTGAHVHYTRMQSVGEGGGGAGRKGKAPVKMAETA